MTSPEVDRDPLACRVRWHAVGCVVVTCLDGSTRHEVTRYGNPEPQGEMVRLFEPAPTQITGQLTL